MSTVTDVAVCIATGSRQPGLLRTLAGLAIQDLPADLAAGLRVVVVDNTARAEARGPVDRVRPGYPWPLVYVHEPRRGISFARNAALDNTAGTEFIAFIDDDEVPDPDWLGRLFQVQRRFDADVVGGPVVPRFETVPPGWVEAGRFLETARLPDGTALNTAYTGNVLFRRTVARGLGLRFSEKLSPIGGEDIDFFDRMKRAGCDLRYCDTAVVRETIPPERATLGWLLRRWFRTGNSDALLAMSRHRGPAGRVLVAGRGLLRLGLGLGAFGAMVLVAGFGRPHRIVGRLYTVARGAGMLASAVNLHYHEYASP